MNALGWFLQQVVQEKRDDLDLFGPHRLHCVGELVLDHEVKEGRRDNLRGCCWHQAALSHNFAMLQLVC